MLAADFIDWWFSPWRYAQEPITPCCASDLVGQRDAYRSWCLAQNLSPALPAELDPRWQCAAIWNTDLLQRAATLFMGLIVAREPASSALATLPFSDQKWCLTIAATQPLQAFTAPHPDDTATLEQRGLAELAIRLEHDFAGLWPRMKLLLPIPQRAAIDLLRQNCWADGALVARGARRAQRCWQLCCQRSNAKVVP